MHFTPHLFVLERTYPRGGVGACAQVAAAVAEAEVVLAMLAGLIDGGGSLIDGHPTPATATATTPPRTPPRRDSLAPADDDGYAMPPHSPATPLPGSPLSGLMLDSPYDKALGVSPEDLDHYRGLTAKAWEASDLPAIETSDLTQSEKRRRSSGGAPPGAHGKSSVNGSGSGGSRGDRGGDGHGRRWFLVVGLGAAVAAGAAACLGSSGSEFLEVARFKSPQPPLPAVAESALATAETEAEEEVELRCSFEGIAGLYLHTDWPEVAAGAPRHLVSVPVAMAAVRSVRQAQALLRPQFAQLCAETLHARDEQQAASGSDSRSGGAGVGSGVGDGPFAGGPEAFGPDACADNLLVQLAEWVDNICQPGQDLEGDAAEEFVD